MAETVKVMSLEGLSERERLECAIRSTDEHLFMENGRVLVCGPDRLGGIRILGSVDPFSSLQIGAPTLRELIDHVRFGLHVEHNLPKGSL